MNLPSFSRIYLQNYEIKYSVEYIRVSLKRSNLSYKRAKLKPIKADKSEQEAFKKMCTIDELFESINSIYSHSNEDFNVIKSLVYARNYYS